MQQVGHFHDLGPFVHTPEKFVAGQTKFYTGEWCKITKDRWVLDNIKGIAIPLTHEPCQLSTPKPYHFSKRDKHLADVQVSRMLELGIIEETATEQGEWISNIFTRPKPLGDVRIILDLTELNKYVEYQHFKMCSLQTALELVDQGVSMASIDLKDAYYSIPVRVEDRKYLKFSWNHKLYRFTVLPNGLACVPRFFTKLLSPVFASARKEGVECVPFIDDTFIVAPNVQDCVRSVKTLATLLDNLGFVIHPVKSVLRPTKQLKFLGFCIDSESMTVTLPEEKVKKFQDFAWNLLSKEQPTIRDCAVVVGLMIAYGHGVQYGPAHAKSLEADRNRALLHASGDFDQKMSISNEGRQDLLWWLENISRAQKKISLEPPHLTIATDKHEWLGCLLGKPINRWALETGRGRTY